MMGDKNNGFPDDALTCDSKMAHCEKKVSEWKECDVTDHKRYCDVK